MSAFGEHILTFDTKSDPKILDINKNSAEVDIAPAFGEITTACNVGQEKKGHGACLKSGQLVYARFHTHSHRCCREMYFNSRLDIKFGQSEWSMKCKSVERKLKVKGTRSRFLLQECVKDNYYARFHPHS